MTSTELGIYKMVPNKEFNTYWVPCTWFTALLKDIKSQKRIPDPLGVKHIMEVRLNPSPLSPLMALDRLCISLVGLDEF